MNNPPPRPLAAPPSSQSAAVAEIARVFLKLGATAFGGPAAHIALMHQEVVVRRRWLTPQAFLDLVGATNLIPGPNSTEMAIHLGLRRAGWPGLLTAGVCFIVPAVAIVWALAAVYLRVGMMPEVRAVFRGVAPVLVVVVGVALWKLGAIVVRTRTGAAITLAALAGLALGVHELVVLACAALTGVLLSRTLPRDGTGALALAIGWPFAAAPVGVAGSLNLASLFTVFLKAGALLFGSGYVLIAFLRADLVTRTGWLTEAQLIDAIAVGQMTPGPVFTTATFVGYLLGRSSGALVATIGIFLPAFIYVALSGRLVPRIRASPIAAGALDGVNAASLAMMAVVSWQLARASLIDTMTMLLAAGAVIVVAVLRVNPTWPIVAGGVAGWIGGRVT